MELDFFTSWAKEYRFELCVTYLILCCLFYLAGDDK